MNRNLQLRTHPDADQLSVFVEGAATAREQEKMLAHLAECAECRNAVFLMQPHEQPQRVTATLARGWMWRWLVPVGLPATALVCGLIAVLIHIRPHGGAPGTPRQVASVRPLEAERPGTTAAPSTNAQEDKVTPATNSEQVSRSERQQNGFAPRAPANRFPRQQNRTAAGLNLRASESGQAIGGAAPQIAVGGPITSVQTAEASSVQNTISSTAISDLPLNGRNFTALQQLQPADTKGAASQDSSAKKKELPALQIQGASPQNEMLAGISGRMTDRSGAVITGVTVTLRDAAGKTRQTTTGADGRFYLTQLPAGQYQLTATASGFKASQQSIELKPSELAMLQPVLDVGTASEVVEVEAASAAASIQTESANVGQVDALSGVGRVRAVPSGLPVAETVSYGKQSLSLDDAGNLFLSRNGGKKWKKVKPQWAGKAIRIELTSGSVSEAAQKPKDKTSGAAGEGAVFLLSTDGGTVWSSKDGAHWHQQ